MQSAHASIAHVLSSSPSSAPVAETGPLAKRFDVRTIEMHTGGEAVRIVASGYPTLHGKTLLEKRRDAKERADAFRRLLMHGVF